MINGSNNERIKIMDEIKKHLTDGEEILWYEKAHYSVLSKYELLCIPLTLLIFGGFSLLFTLNLYMRFLENPGLAFYFLTAGLLVYIVSFYFLIGRFLYAKKRRNNETYVLTNKRALVVTDVLDLQIVEIRLSDAKIREAKNTVYFSDENPSVEIFYALGLDALLKMRPKKSVVFKKIKDAQKVVAIAQDSINEGKNDD